MSAAETGLFLSHLRCAGCVGRVERELRAMAGVEEASVNFTTERALVRFDPARVSARELVERVSALGYDARPYDPALLDRPAERNAREALTRVLVAAFLAANVMVISAALYIGAAQGMEPAVRRALRWLGLTLSLPAVTWCALPFWRGAWGGLARREVTMDLPIVLGVTAAFGGSLLGTLAGSDHVFADSAATIVFLILLGRTLERRARARAADAVERLLALSPRTALRLTATGPEEVAATSLVPGDLVVVAPGDAVPADGRIRAGETELDESLLTGESHPVLRRVGDRVTGGTRNALTEIRVEVEASVESGTLARLAALFERAQAERPRVQQLADRVARIFAPTVLGLAALTASGWALAGAEPLEVLLTTAAVLIVACPCALGLATPAAVTAAIGRAARLGVLLKSGEALERCARVDAALLDKTGTLTEGRLALEEIHGLAGLAEKDLLALAAAAEGSSLHPVARAVARAAEERGVAATPAKDRRALAGRGVEAQVGGRSVLVGTRALLEARGVTVPDALLEAARGAARSGLTLAWLADGGHAVGVLALSDPPRPDARAGVERLRDLGIEARLVTGDHGDAARRAARCAGLERVESGVSPEGKVERVRAWRAAGRSVLAVGDGINDAAALAAADVGIAMAGGAEVALHAADAVVRAPRFGAVTDLLELSRATLSRIRENLGLALAYNAVAIPLAAAGGLEPLGAAIAMSLSSLLVTGNAVRLLRWRPSR